MVSWKAVAVLLLVVAATLDARSHHGAKRHKTESAHQHKRMNSAGKPPDPKEAPLEFDNAAVAADNEICSKIGADILKKKGTAADAIVSTHCCVEIVNSHSTGLGGGGFMVYYDKKTGNKKAYDFRESLVAAYTDSSSKTQGETILVPGVLRGLEAVHKDFGVLPWKDLWQPCIKLAREGFRIHEALAAGIKKKKDYIESNLGLRELFAPDGTILTLGDMLKRPKLARTFEKIANEGPEVFYRGTMAKQIVEDIRAAGGVMTVDDLAGFQVRETNPLQTKVNGMDVLTVPAPASGALMALSLKILAEGKWNPQKFTKSPETYYHEYIEAMKLAYAPTTYLSDPRFSNITEQVEKYMIDDSTAKTMYKKIDGNAHNIEDYKPYSQLFATEKTGTSHMSILDQNGSAVSLTSSINAYFGSKLRSRELGFIYNNELADFSEFWPKIYNLTSDVKIPGKRPMSRSMPTVFLKNKEVQGVWGAAGGFFIPAAITMSIANWMFFNDNLKVAITRPRLHCQLFPPTVVYEPTLPPQMIPQLEAFSHQSVTNSTYDVSGQLNAIMGVVQAIVRKDNGKIAAECDYRKGGRPAGF